MLPVEIRTASNCVVTVVLGIFLIAIIFQWIRPKQVTHGTKCRRFCKSINLKTTKDRVIMKLLVIDLLLNIM